MPVTINGDGTVSINLNADELDGVTLTELAQLSGATFTGTINVSSGELQVAGDQVAEYGSNSNGEYVRLHNGVQICGFQGDLSGILSVDRHRWTFPAAFVSEDGVWYASVRSGQEVTTGGHRDSYLYRVQANNILVQNYDPSDHSRVSTDPFYALCFAAGRWK